MKELGKAMICLCLMVCTEQRMINWQSRSCTRCCSAYPARSSKVSRPSQPYREKWTPFHRRLMKSLCCGGLSAFHTHFQAPLITTLLMSSWGVAGGRALTSRKAARALLPQERDGLGFQGLAQSTSQRSTSGSINISASWDGAGNRIYPAITRRFLFWITWILSRKCLTLPRCCCSGHFYCNERDLSKMKIHQLL